MKDDDDSNGHVAGRWLPEQAISARDQAANFGRTHASCFRSNIISRTSLFISIDAGALHCYTHAAAAGSYVVLCSADKCEGVTLVNGQLHFMSSA